MRKRFDSFPPLVHKNEENDPNWLFLDNGNCYKASKRINQELITIIEIYDNLLAQILS